MNYDDSDRNLGSVDSGYEKGEHSVERSPETDVNEHEESTKRVLALYDRFYTAASDEYRNARLKMTPRVVEGPWLVRKAVGKGDKAAKLAEHIELKYYRDAADARWGGEGEGEDSARECDGDMGRYLEVEVNVSNSAVGNSILSVVARYIHSVTIDLGMTIEGTEEHELPERLLGALRFHNLDINAPFLPPYNGGAE